MCDQIGGVLLLGQHAEDQLETVLLQLKRGAGPQGLAGMGEVQYRGDTLIMRPMLALEKPRLWLMPKRKCCSGLRMNLISKIALIGT